LSIGQIFSVQWENLDNISNLYHNSPRFALLLPPSPHRNELSKLSISNIEIHAAFCEMGGSFSKNSSSHELLAISSDFRGSTGQNVDFDDKTVGHNCIVVNKSM
jgi:hypothetical protein